MPITIVLAALLLAACDDAETKTADGFLASGTAHLEEGRITAAAIQFKNAVQLEPQNANPRTLLAQAYMALDDAASAQNQLERAIQLGDEREETRILLAQSKSRLGQHDEILRFTETYGEFDRDDTKADFLAVKAKSYFTLGVTTTAQRLLDTVLEGGPHAAALIVSARIALEAGQRSRAIVSLDQAIAAEPGNVEALLLRAQTAMDAGDRFGGRNVLRQAHEAAPQSPTVRLALARAEAGLRDFESAKSLVDKVAAISPQDGRVRYLQAYIALGMEDYELARTLSEDLVGDAPRHAPALAIAGSANMVLEHFELAREYFNKYLAERPGDVRVTLLLARVMQELDDQAAVIDLLSQIRENSAEPSYAALNRAAELALRAGDGRLSLAFVYDVLRNHPNSARARRVLALLRDQVNKAQEQQREIAANDNFREVMLDQDEPLVGGEGSGTSGLLPQWTLDAYNSTLVADHGVALGYTSLSDPANEEDARQHFRSAIAAEPWNRNAATGLAYLLAKDGDLTEASSVFQPLAEAVPNDRAVSTAYAALNRQEDDAVPQLEQLLISNQRSSASLNSESSSAAAAGVLAANDPQGGSDDGEQTAEEFHNQILFLVNRDNLDAALSVAERFKERFPNDPVAYNDSALVFLALNRVEEAIENYRKALNVAPDNSPAALNLGQLLAARGDLGGAAQVLSSFLANRPDHGKARIEYAEVQARLGNIENAESILRDTVALYPEVLEPHAVLARFLTVQNRAEDAVALLAPLSERFSDDEVYLDTLAFAQTRANDHRSAAETFEKLSAVASDPVAPLLSAAKSYREVPDIAAAVATLERLLEASEQHVSARSLLAELLIEDRALKQARQQLTILDAQQPENAAVSELWAAYYTAQGELEEAVAALDRSMQLQSTSARAIKLSFLQLQLGELDEAMSTIERRLETAPGDIPSRRQAIVVSIAKDDNEVALRHIEELMEMEGPTSSTLNNKAVALWKLGRLDAAKESAENAIALTPSDLRLQYTLGIILLDLGQSAEALRIIESAQPAYESNGSFSYQLARALAENNKESAAISELETVLRSDSAFPERQQAETLLRELQGKTD